MRGAGQQVDTQGIDIDGDLADGLGRVGEQQGPGGVGQRGDGGQVLQHPGLVVGKHGDDEQGLGVKGGGQVGQVQAAIDIDREARDTEAAFLERVAGVEDGLVLGGEGDDVAALGGVGGGHALDGGVEGLGRAAGEGNLLRHRTDQLRDGLTRHLHGLRRRPAILVGAAGRIAEVRREKGEHRLQDPGIEGRGGVVVEVDGQGHAAAAQFSATSSTS